MLQALALALPLSVISCTKDSGSNPDGRIPLNISAFVDSHISVRAGDTSFEEGDAVGLTLVKWKDAETPATLADFRYEDNARYVYSQGAFSAESVVYFPEQDGKYTLFAYYPQGASGFTKGQDALDVTVSNRQDKKDNYTCSDYMYAAAEGIAATEQAIELGFTHILSKITVNLIAGDSMSEADLADAEVSLSRFPTSATYNVAEGIFEEIGSFDKIIMKTEGTVSNAIVVPHKVKSGERLFTIKAAGNVYDCMADKDYDFASGTSNVFDITLNAKAAGTPLLTMSSRWID